MYLKSKINLRKKKLLKRNIIHPYQKTEIDDIDKNIKIEELPVPLKKEEY